MTQTYNLTQDPYAQRSTAVASQARNAAAVTPSDSANLSPYAKSLYIGVAGNVTVVPINAASDSETVTFANHPVGYMPMQVRRVMATGTAATNIVALFDIEQ